MNAPRFDLGEIKARLPLSQLVGQAVTWDLRKSNTRRGDWWAPCPFHQERTPSFHVEDAKGVFYCFGCQAKGDHVDWAQEMLGADGFPRAVEMLAGIAGVGPAVEASPRRPREAREPRLDEAEARGARRKLAAAAEIWRASRRGPEPVLMDYLAARGVDVDVLAHVWGGPPPAIRMHPELPCLDQATGREVHRGPAMVALIGGVGGPVGIHRTWITPEGRQVIDGWKLPKMWLGLTGAMHGRPVRITAHSDRMIVGEGIETVLALWSRLMAEHLAGRGPFWSAEAALALGALTGGAVSMFRGPGLNRAGKPLASPVPDMDRPGWTAPDYVRELVILAEGSAKDPEEAERRFRCAWHRHRVDSRGQARRCDLSLPGRRWDRDCDWADAARAIAGGDGDLRSWGWDG